MYWTILCSLGALVLGLVLYEKSVSPKSSTQSPDTAQDQSKFKTFQRSYLIVYGLATLADWLQGPYSYRVYADAGLPVQTISYLFLTGFGSSFLFGTIIASAADVFGKAMMCKLYCVLYAAACILVHGSSVPLLFTGRLLSGVATSILFSCFDAWMVSAHQAQSFTEKQLSSTFSYATMLSSAGAIAAGGIAQVAAGISGAVGPFQVSALVCVACFVGIQMAWAPYSGAADGQSVSAAGGRSGGVLAGLRAVGTAVRQGT